MTLDDGAAAALRSDVDVVEPGTTRPRRLARVVQIMAVVVMIGAIGFSTWAKYHETDRRRIPGAAGYFRYAGPRGDLLPVGRPWGTPCMPVRFTFEQTVPQELYVQASAVVAEARRHGINVALETRTFTWNAALLYFPPGVAPGDVPRVGIFGDFVDREVEDGHRETIRLFWNASPDPNTDHENLESQDVKLHLPVLMGDDLAARQAFRKVVAFSQGIIRTTNDASGIAAGTAIDAFTTDDINAVRVMSGCRRGLVPG